MSTTVFPADFFINNRQKLRELFSGTAPIVLTAHGQLQSNGDISFPFRQESSFWYLTGIDDPDVVLVLDKAKEYLILPERGVSRVAFDGVLDQAVLSSISGIQTVLDEKNGWKQLGARLKKVKHVATLAASPAYVEQLGMYTNPARAELIRKLKSFNPELELLDLREHLTRLRMIKQEIELEAINEAISATIGAIKRISQPSLLGKYTNEYEVEADIIREFRRLGLHNAFSPTIAAGSSAVTIHHTDSVSPIEQNVLMVVDVGAEVCHYSADITRTLAIGKLTPRQQAVYASVYEVQEYAISLLKPGAVLKTYEKQVETFMGEKLRELGLIKTITTEAVRHYYPHAASHFLGLDTHDSGIYNEPLVPNMVVTCEPGIYIPEEGIGVRIEDDILITKVGNQNLSARLPRSVD
jgi:Xaa-Pro aminopeptidase